MFFKSKRTSLIVLATTALICSRMLFFFFNDPEGPNLVVVIGLATLIYLLSLVAYVFSRSKVEGFNRLLIAICVQILVIIVFYFSTK